MADVDVPEFTWVYAFLIVVFILGLVSLFKPKQDYKPFSINQFDDCNSFCLARVQWWTVRFIFYYVQPAVAGPLFIITIILISVLSAKRLDDEFYDHVKAVKNHYIDTNADDICSDLEDLLQSTLGWSDQLTWMLIIYFFQKLFGATLFLNGGGLATIAAMVFDPWLYLSSIWGIALFYGISDVVSDSSFDACYNVALEEAVVDSFEVVLENLNAFCMILWILCALSLPFGIVIDYLFTVFREWNYGIKSSAPNNSKMDEKEPDVR